MRLSPVLKCLGILTFFALCYIHMQMQIISLAYQQEAQASDIRDLLEENGNLVYNILMLKSPKHLGQKMLSQETGMQFVDPDNIILISASEDFNPREEIKTSRIDRKGINSLFSLLPTGSRAEAKPRP